MTVGVKPCGKGDSPCVVPFLSSSPRPSGRTHRVATLERFFYDAPCRMHGHHHPDTLTGSPLPSQPPHVHMWLYARVIPTQKPGRTGFLVRRSRDFQGCAANEARKGTGSQRRPCVCSTAWRTASGFFIFSISIPRFSPAVSVTAATNLALGTMPK